MNFAEHGNAASPARPRYRADLTARRVRGRSIGRTKEAKASGNALDMPTLVWSEMARKQAEPLVSPEKQMTASTCWLMRPGATAHRSGGHCGCLQVSPSCSVRFGGTGRRAGHKISDRSYEDLSRMKGNFHVRFLGECGRGNPPALTRPSEAVTHNR